MKGVLYAVLSATLFGASTPLAKSMLAEVSPFLLAGLLYLGSGVGLLALLGVRWLMGWQGRETPLSRGDLPWLVGGIAFGGILGPLLLMWGLHQTAASTSSLLLNLEGVFTAVLAWFVFRENFDRRIALGMALIAAGGISLSWLGRPEFGVPWGALAIAGACLAWAVDNNLTRNISASDPVQIAFLKGLGAGSVNTALGLVMGAKMPSLTVLLASGGIGFAGYGLSLTLFVLALRHLGTARAGAYFSLAPFVGAVLSVLFLGDALSPGLALAALLMGAGVWLHLTERHAHEHRHTPLEHDHSHTHDEHHQHGHKPGDPPGEPHSHSHRHDENTHSHPHYPDLHHRHDH